MSKKLMAVLAAAVALAALVALGGCSGSESSSSASSAAASASSESEGAAAQDATVFGEPEVVDVLSGDRSKVVGTSANFYAAKADCTEEKLAQWYGEYVDGSGHNWCTIVFTDDPAHGVAARAGMVEVGVELEKDDDGSYGEVGSEGATVYVYESGALKKLE